MRSILRTFQVTYEYFEFRHKLGLILYATALLCLSLLDLVATLLFSAGIYSISGSQINLTFLGQNLSSLLEKENLTSNTLFIVAISAIILKNILSLITTKNLFLYLARIQQALTSKVSVLVTKQNYETIKRINFQEATNAMTAGMNSIIVGITGLGISFLSEFFLLTLLAFTLLSIDFVTFGVVFIYFLFCSFCIIAITSKRVASLGKEMVSADVISREIFTEILLLWRELKVGNLISHHLNHFLKSSRNLSQSFARSNWLQTLPKYFMELVGLSSIIIFWYVVNLNNTEIVAASKLYVFIAFSSRLLPSLLKLQNSFIAMKNCQGNATYALKFLDFLNSRGVDSVKSKKVTAPEIAEPGEGLPLISMRGVSFKYEDANFNALTDIDFDLWAGDRVALFGISGSGKSTFCDLICGFLTPNSGSIHHFSKENGEPLDLAFLPQEVSLISATISENITLKRIEVEDQGHVSDVLKALESAEVLEFINTLPDGLSTLIGNANTGLSGGQKQRLGIARALYRKSDILIMDEPGSSLDGETEELILATINNLNEKQSLIYISHRPASLKYFSKIVFFDRGRVQGIGGFNKLYTDYPRFRLAVNASRINFGEIKQD
jgi:ABC-type bacteriocin/lantibiotic exporter with double-glycine peptidase domain